MSACSSGRFHVAETSLDPWIVSVEKATYQLTCVYAWIMSSIWAVSLVYLAFAVDFQEALDQRQRKGRYDAGPSTYRGDYEDNCTFDNRWPYGYLQEHGISFIGQGTNSVWMFSALSSRWHI